MSFSGCDLMSTSYVCRMHITGFDIRYLVTCWLDVNRCFVDLRSSPVMGQYGSTRTISIHIWVLHGDRLWIENALLTPFWKGWVRAFCWAADRLEIWTRWFDWSSSDSGRMGWGRAAEARTRPRFCRQNVGGGGQNHVAETLSLQSF
jgi:hypothetical protein